MDSIKAICTYIRQQITALHPYSKNVIRGTFQFMCVLYLMAAVIYYLAPYVPDYFLAMKYYESLASIAPVTLGVGIIAGLLCDLVLRKEEKK